MQHIAVVTRSIAVLFISEQGLVLRSRILPYLRGLWRGAFLLVQMWKSKNVSRTSFSLPLSVLSLRNAGIAEGLVLGCRYEQLGCSVLAFIVSSYFC